MFTCVCVCVMPKDSPCMHGRLSCPNMGSEGVGVDGQGQVGGMGIVCKIRQAT